MEARPAEMEGASPGPLDASIPRTGPELWCPRCRRVISRPDDALEAPPLGGDRRLHRQPRSERMVLVIRNSSPQA